MQIYLTTVGEAAVKDGQWSWRHELDQWSPVTTDTDYATRMADIRARAVDEWECNGGDNCTPGTNRFLRAFALPEVTADDWTGDNSCGIHSCEVCESERESTKYVMVTVTLQFEVTNDADEYDTYADVERYLRVEVGGRVDDVSNESMSVDDIRVSTCCHDC